VPSSDLQPVAFAAYPPLARQFAEEHLNTLRRLPVVFAALLLREICEFDWMFPEEQGELRAQLESLKDGGASAALRASLADFTALPLSPDLFREPWAAQPERFVEKLTAYLWTVHAMDAFRAAAMRYGEQLALERAHADRAVPRLCIVVIGRDAPAGNGALFRKLRPHGTYFTQFDSRGCVRSALTALGVYARTNSEPYQHWYVDGGALEIEGNENNLTTISYASLTPLRKMILDRIHASRISGAVGPEDLRSQLFQMQPEQFKSVQVPGNDIVRHFELRLLTEGSGTQIFSTTFVQWAGREVLRRARPRTLLLRYAPRQIERSMNELLAASAPEQQFDPQGSLIDGEMGAYYTWLNLMRLPGSEISTFVACHEGGSEAIAIAPGMAKGAESKQLCTLEQILRWVS
jgi:hypothetical protein